MICLLAGEVVYHRQISVNGMSRDSAIPYQFGRRRRPLEGRFAASQARRDHLQET
jgi:hypothetical protein